MTVKELIENLQKEDPNAQVLSGGAPIYFVERKPGYYDGHTPLLIEDESKKPHYSVVGYKWDSNQPKVVLQSMNLEDCLYNCNTIEDLENFKILGHTEYVSRAEKLRKEVKLFFKDLSEQ